LAESKESEWASGETRGGGKLGAIGERNPHRHVVALAEPCVGGVTHCRFDNHDCRPRKRNVGDEGKAVGRGPPTALLFEQGAQYKISKTKLSISMIAVTPATESTKASLASW
jgi:hypothetical protein